VDGLVEDVREARRHERNVAFHCASRLGLVLTLAALEHAGSRPGDRIEHGAVVPDDAMVALRSLGLTVVTQPAFVRARGDRYRADVDDDDVPFLWRCGSLMRAGIPVLGSSDGPHGPSDPWQAMRTAVDRRTASGAVLGADERVTPEQALALYTARRRVAPGSAADLCLLDAPVDDVLARPDVGGVRLTVIDGDVVTS
jgi:predicted amidohydrolase YtcJ